MTRSVHIIGSRASGGAERFYGRLVGALHQRGEPVLAVCPPGSAVAQELNRSGAPVQPLAMRSVWDLAARWRIKRIVRDFDADIVQTYMGRATRLTHLPRDRRPVHVARLGGYYDLKGYRHAHAWVGNTRGICDYLLDNGLPTERVFHIGNFVDPPTPVPADRIERLRTELGIGSDALVVTSAGRLHPNKGFPDLLEAFARLPREIDGRAVHLMIAGDGPLADELKAQGTRLGLDGRLHWAGWQTELGPYYALGDLFVCPSRHEPLGNVILEAWNHGAPLLSTRSLGAEELITDGDNGRLVPVQDPTALAGAMEELLRAGPAARGALAERGRATVADHHSREAVVDGYLAMYATLLGPL